MRGVITLVQFDGRVDIDLGSRDARGGMKIGLIGTVACLGGGAVQAGGVDGLNFDGDRVDGTCGGMSVDAGWGFGGRVIVHVVHLGLQESSNIPHETIVSELST